MNAAALRERCKAVEDDRDEPIGERLRRAASWLGRAEQEASDADARFMFLWISFAACYACETGADVEDERRRFRRFFHQLLQIDGNQRLQKLLFDKFSGPIRTLVANHFVFPPFWRAQREQDSAGRWRMQLRSSKRAALRAIVQGDTLKVLSIVFDRLYVLRNQMVHGGAAWNSASNRAQVRDGATILFAIVPIIIELMLEHPDLDFGPVNFLLP